MVSVTLLGSAQDGGVPQAGSANSEELQKRYPVAIGLVDSDGGRHLFDVSRYLAEQLQIWGQTGVDSIFLTHAHIGHVDGLTLFGKEVMNCQGITLNCSKIMHDLIKNTPIWSIMVDQGVFTLKTNNFVKLPGVTVEAIEIPHRAELSDMHAYIIKADKSLLYLPDHDTWRETLNGHDLRAWLNHLEIDIALIDGTFFSKDELTNRKQEEIPHPPVEQTLEMLGERREGDGEIVFIHLNHTNPLCRDDTPVTEMGWKVGQEGMRFLI